ncbi:MAG: hypothetical protein ACLGIJ_03000 [Candidatus Limnocylindria bacterium]
MRESDLHLDRATGRAGAAGARPNLPVALANERHIWSLSASATAALLVVPIGVVGTGLALAAAAPDTFFALTKEDAVVETTQVGALLIAAGAGGILVRGLAAAGMRWQAALTALAVLTVVGVAGEEISWGQRILGVATPAAFDSINVQGETNIHNIGALELLVRLGQTGVAGLLVAIPLLALVLRRAFASVDRLLIPPLVLAPWFAPLAIYWLIRLILDPDETIWRFSEVPELTLYVGLALLALLHLRRVRPSPAGAREPMRGRPAG